MTGLVYLIATCMYKKKMCLLTVIVVTFLALPVPVVARSGMNSESEGMQ